MVSLCAASLYQSRQDALDRARETSRNVALIAERDIERNFELYGLSLQSVVDGLGNLDVMALPPRLRNQILFDGATAAKNLGSMLVFDASGKIIIDAGNDAPRTGNFADRDYFVVQRDNPNAGLYVQHTVSFASAQWCAQHRIEPPHIEPGRFVRRHRADGDQPPIFSRPVRRICRSDSTAPFR